MLIKLFGGLLQRRKKPLETLTERQVDLDEASKLMANGDMHAAIVIFRKALELDPSNVAVMNNLGVCLVDVGNNAEANAVFELAYSLDDTYMPVIVNHAKMFVEQGRSIDGLPFLRQAKACDLNFTHVDAVYASYCLRMGDVPKARYFQERAWLANFEKMRYANCHLFYAAYDDIDELLLAAEHRFWAETARPIDPVKDSAKNDLDMSSQPASVPERGERKIRIGYWSPDLRNHSVRYFFRPLIENHDQSKFDIFLYNDGPNRDAQTDLIEGASTYCHNVYTVSDVDLYKLIRSHDLDILVELAGHSSYNRITLLQQRFAPTQITALGYPPTTGLQSIDAKLLDRFIATPEDQKYYSEQPLVLPSSFWCFDPKEDVPVILDPPFNKNGFITFACVGNVAKINDRILRCWKSILDQVPGSRLLIRAINFEDPAAEDAVQARLKSVSIDIGRVDLRKPEGGSSFFGTYGEIDIILDTYPFNGGTTTCFATYMGVPVVSLTGTSLISRMGLSVLSNLDVPELAVSNSEAYIERAISVANDHAFLQRFRREARDRFKNSCLGNGKLFAQEFEQACVTLLAQRKSQQNAYQHAIPALPADEIVRRAHAAMQEDQPEAVLRILNHCLRHYPDHGGVHLTVAQLNMARDPAEAIDYLAARLEKFTPAEQVRALTKMARWHLLLGQDERAQELIDALLGRPIADDLDRMQVHLYQACCVPRNASLAPEKLPSEGGAMTVRVLIPCDSLVHFEAMCSQIKACCQVPYGWAVSYQRCNEGNRVAAYNNALRLPGLDALVFVQKNVEIHNPMFLTELVKALGHCDVLGVHGATRWQRMNWRTDAFDCKVAGFLSPSLEKAGFAEIHWLGATSEPVVGGLAILDGSMLAVVPSKLRNVVFDEELLGAEFMLEEDWTHTAFQKGLRLAVHRNLGVLLPQKMTEEDTRVRAPGLMRALQKYDFDPFSTEPDDVALVSAPVASASDAVRIVDIYLEMSF